jgi:hypothetical protein
MLYFKYICVGVCIVTNTEKPRNTGRKAYEALLGSVRDIFSISFIPEILDLLANPNAAQKTHQRKPSVFDVTRPSGEEISRLSAKGLGHFAEGNDGLITYVPSTTEFIGKATKTT